MCDLCTEMPKPTDGGKTYTFKIRPGVKFHDGSALTAKDVHASFQRIVFPQQGVSSARKAQFSMVESITAPDDQTVVFKLKHPSGAFIPALANPFNWIYAKAILDKDQHWFEKNVMGSGPFIFETHEAGAVVKGKRNPDYHSRGQALSRRLRGDLRQDADAARAGDPRRPGCGRVPGLPAQEPRRPRCGARQGHHGAGERLELRPARNAQLQEEALRRRARAQGAHPRRGSLGRVQGPFQDRHRQGGRRRRVPWPSAGGQEGGAREARRLLAGHQQVARGGQEAPEGGRRPRPQVHALQPRRRPALHHRRHLADRPVEAGRRHRRAEGRGHRSVLCFAERRQLRRDDGLQLPGGRQSAVGYVQVPA